MSQLEHQVERVVCAPVSSDIADALVGALQAEQASNLVGIIFYGSRLTRTAGAGSEWDFFVVIDDYRQAHRSRFHALLNRVAPPGVYSREIPLPDGSTARCKLSILSMGDLDRYTSAAAPDSYVFGRLSKRVALVHSRDAAARQAIVTALARAVTTSTSWCLMDRPEYASLEAFARAAVAFSYRCEERVEGPQRANALFDADAAYYLATYEVALNDAEELGSVRLDAAGGGVVRAPRDLPARGDEAAVLRFIGRSRRRARLRWIKNVVTFEGWVEYIVAKIERHQGINITLNARERRHPLIAAAKHYLRLRRQGALSRPDL